MDSNVDTDLLARDWQLALEAALKDDDDFRTPTLVSLLGAGAAGSQALCVDIESFALLITLCAGRTFHTAIHLLLMLVGRTTQTHTHSLSLQCSTTATSWSTAAAPAAAAAVAAAAPVAAAPVAAAAAAAQRQRHRQRACSLLARRVRAVRHRALPIHRATALLPRLPRPRLWSHHPAVLLRPRPAAVDARRAAAAAVLILLISAASPRALL